MLKIVLIYLIGALLILLTIDAAEAKVYTYKNGLKITASDFGPASKMCFNKLTGGVYPGEEKGLDIIDICVNPIDISK